MEQTVLKAVFFDLDDTLLHDDLSISDYTVRVLQKLHEQGTYIVPASGRARLSMKPYVDQLACVKAYISCNGAEIWDGVSGRLLFQELFPAETVSAIAAFAEDNHCYAHVYEGNRFYFNRRSVYAERYAASSGLEGCYVGNLCSFVHEPRNKILMIDEEPRIAALYEQARTLFDGKASVTCSKPCFLEFNPPAATKGNALRTLSGMLGFDPAESIAFGDSLNDLSMLRAAGTGVAVSNGWEELKRLSDCICGSNNQDGPAHFLNDHFLHGEVVS